MINPNNPRPAEFWKVRLLRSILPPLLQLCLATIHLPTLQLFQFGCSGNVDVIVLPQPTTKHRIVHSKLLQYLTSKRCYRQKPVNGKLDLVISFWTVCILIQNKCPWLFLIRTPFSWCSFIIRTIVFSVFVLWTLSFSSKTNLKFIFTIWFVLWNPLKVFFS